MAAHTGVAVTHIHIYIYIYIVYYIWFCDNVAWNCPWSSATGQLKHSYYKRSFQDIVFHSVHTIFPVKNTIIYTLCPRKSVQNTSFGSVFNILASGIQKPFKVSLVAVFFHFWSFFHCRKPAKMTQTSISMHSEAQTSENRRKNTKTPAGFGLGWKIAVSVRNRFWAAPPSS